MERTSKSQIQVSVLVPQERLAEFYSMVGAWLQSEQEEAKVRSGGRRSSRSSDTPSVGSEPSGRYAPLARYLQEQQGPVELSFDRIEEILGESLPASARRHRAFWANSETSGRARGWLSVGWRVVSADLDNETIGFRPAA